MYIYKGDSDSGSATSYMLFAERIIFSWSDQGTRLRRLQAALLYLDVACSMMIAKVDIIPRHPSPCIHLSTFFEHDYPYFGGRHPKERRSRRLTIFGTTYICTPYNKYDGGLGCANEKLTF